MSHAKLVQLIETSENRGEGTSADPVRSVRQWFTVEGELVVESAPLPTSQRCTRCFKTWRVELGGESQKKGGGPHYGTKCPSCGYIEVPPINVALAGSGGTL